MRVDHKRTMTFPLGHARTVLEQRTQNNLDKVSTCLSSHSHIHIHLLLFCSNCISLSLVTLSTHLIGRVHSSSHGYTNVLLTLHDALISKSRNGLERTQSMKSGEAKSKETLACERNCVRTPVLCSYIAVTQ
jgi:hypothetical protein